MNIGVARVSLRLPENMSLKGKRGIVRSISGRVRHKFEVAVAEVDDNDAWHTATIGICCISNDRRHSNQVISHTVDFIVNGHFDVEVLDYETEIIDI